MNIIQEIAQGLGLYTPRRKPVVFDTAYVFPYDADPLKKREQVWENLQKGLLLEDTGQLIPWTTSYADIDTLATDRRTGGDRMSWFLGTRTVLDGYTCRATVKRWAYIKETEPFSKIEEYLGDDYVGHERFLLLIERFKTLLGKPDYESLESFGTFDIGTVSWQRGNVCVSLNGIEQFCCKYRLYVGVFDWK